MNSFGLGLVLDFTDNASAGMQRASSVFQQFSGVADSTVGSLQALSVASQGLARIGGGLASLGGGIVSAFVGAGRSLISTGGLLFGARNQLAKLSQGSAEAAEATIQRMKTYAQESIFAFEDLIPLVTGLKTVGIDAFTELGASMGGARQTLLDFAGDLAAFNPQARNAYGTGIQAAAGAMREYIAEGNALSLKRAFSLDISQVLGEGTAGSAEARMQQIADMMGNLGMTGMVASLYGTADQMINNMADTWFNFTTMISDTGVLSGYTALIEKLFDYVGAIPQEEMESLARGIGEMIQGVFKWASAAIDKFLELADAARGFLEEHPNFVKIASVVGLIAGGAVLLSGIALKLGGSFGMLVGGLRTLGMVGTGTGGILSMIGRTLLGIVPFALAAAGAGLIIKTAWERDFAGVQGFVEKMAATLRMSFSILSRDDSSISAEDYDLMQKLGLTSLMEGVTQAKNRMGDFREGLLAGFEETFGGIFGFIEDLLPEGTKLGDVFSDLGVALKDATGLDTADKWKSVGEEIGKVAGVLAFALPTIKLVGAALGFLTSPLGLISSAVAGLALAYDNNFMGMKDKLAPFMETLGEFASDFTGNMKLVGDYISGAGLPEADRKKLEEMGLLPVLDIMKKVSDGIPGLMNNMGGFFEGFLDGLKKNVEQLDDFLKNIGLPTLSELFGIITDNSPESREKFRLIGEAIGDWGPKLVGAEIAMKGIFGLFSKLGSLALVKFLVGNGGSLLKLPSAGGLATALGIGATAVTATDAVADMAKNSSAATDEDLSNGATSRDKLAAAGGSALGLFLQGFAGLAGGIFGGPQGAALAAGAAGVANRTVGKGVLSNGVNAMYEAAGTYDTLNIPAREAELAAGQLREILPDALEGAVHEAAKAWPLQFDGKSFSSGFTDAIMPMVRVMEEETKRRSEGGEQMPYAEFARLLIDASSIDPEQWSLEKADAMQSVSNAISEFLYSDVPAFFDPAIADLQGGGKGMAKSAEELLKSSRAQSDAARNMQALSDSFAQSSGRLAAEAEALAGRVQLQAPVPTIPGLGFRPMPTIPANANGGIYSSPTFGVWAEDGDEAIIPLSPDKRGRGLGLWGEAGRRLGVEYFADGAIAARGSPPAAAAAGGGAGGGDDYSVTFAPGSVVFSVGAAATGQDIKKYAQILFDEMQRLQRVRQMATRKGSSVVSQLPAGAF